MLLVKINKQSGEVRKIKATKKGTSELLGCEGTGLEVGGIPVVSPGLGFPLPTVTLSQETGSVPGTMQAVPHSVTYKAIE